MDKITVDDIHEELKVYGTWYQFYWDANDKELTWIDFKPTCWDDVNDSPIGSHFNCPPYDLTYVTRALDSCEFEIYREFIERIEDSVSFPVHITDDVLRMTEDEFNEYIVEWKLRNEM